MKNYIAVVLFVIDAAGFAQSSFDIQCYIAKYKEVALEQEKEYGIPASIILAQGILESGAGESELTKKSNNHFGIKKGKNWNGAIYYAWDDEPQKSAFRCYNSDHESFRDHSRFLKNNSRYSNLFSKSVYDYRGWAWGLQQAGYATADNYAKALIGFIDAYKLYAINGGVKLRAGKTVVIKRYITKEKPVFDENCQMKDTEVSEEQIRFSKIMNRYIVDINEVRCTVLLPGETLASVAMKYGISKYKLLEYNETASERDIAEGDIVFLALKKKKYTGAKDYYRVKEGDTLFGISQQFGIRLSSLSKLNGKDFFTGLQPGEKIALK